MEPNLGELPTTDHAMLAPGQLCDSPILRTLV